MLRQTGALLALVVACGDGSGAESDVPTAPPAALPWASLADDWADGALLSVWVGAKDDVWLAGGEAGQGVVLHFDGAAWERRDPPGADTQLWWLHGFASGEVFVVGDRGFAARWDGATWTADATGLAGSTLYGVWGATPDDVWAVGGISIDAPAAEQEGDVVIHWDGVAWSRADVPPLADKPSSAQKNLYKVWGTAADDVWVVGSSGTVLHWDGATWESHDAGLGNTLYFTVTGRARDDVWVVGGFGVAVLIHWDGAAWSEVDLPVETPALLQGVWTAPGQPVYVSGLDGFSARLDGDRWTLGEDIEPRHGLHAIAGDGTGAAWAVGGDILTHLTDHVGHARVSGRTAPPLP